MRLVSFVQLTSGGTFYLGTLVLTHERKEKYPLKSSKQIYQSDMISELCRLVGQVICLLSESIICEIKETRETLFVEQVPFSR